MSGLSDNITAKRGALAAVALGAAFTLGACGSPSNTSYQTYPGQEPSALQSGLSQVFGCEEEDTACVQETGHKVRAALGAGLIVRAY